MKRANLSRTIIIGLLMGLIIFSLSNSVCRAQEKNDKSEERDVWKEIWDKITSHEDARIDADGNIVKESMNTLSDEKDGTSDVIPKEELIELITSRLEIYPGTINILPEITMENIPERGKVYFYELPKTERLEISDLDEDTLRNLLRKIRQTIKL